ncbi:hypothetical protein SAMN00790413_04486 [Deinococcus hopiensis KR-140]|uniref:Uncharacterized protein n=1 Tax=Deinococcus hopiensis KR-140 TaxID=695939 RepID=A0A1W1UK90_9DEIO|nr:hypothetical protein SAMN00790413_04486 [Deinococcus hopiensis KR-140]
MPLPHELTPPLQRALSNEGRYDARKIADSLGLSLRELARLMRRNVGVLIHNMRDCRPISVRS